MRLEGRGSSHSVTFFVDGDRDFRPKFEVGIDFEL